MDARRNFFNVVFAPSTGVSRGTFFLFAFSTNKVTRFLLSKLGALSHLSDRFFNVLSGGVLSCLVQVKVIFVFPFASSSTSYLGAVVVL